MRMRRRFFNIASALSLMVCIAATILSVANSRRMRHENQAALPALISAVDVQIKRTNAAFQELDAFTKSRGPVLSAEDRAQSDALHSVIWRLIAEQNQLINGQTRLVMLSLNGSPIAYRAPIALAAIPPIVWLLFPTLAHRHLDA